MAGERQFGVFRTIHHGVKRKLKWLLVIGLVLVLGGFGGLWVMAGSVASPGRRALQDYHRDYLSGEGDHGIVVTQKELLEGKVPCLIVRPGSVVAKRGEVLRGQLEGMGLRIPVFGKEKGLLVLLHGRNGRKEDLLPVAERFCAVGFVCVIPDLPSHGESPVETVGFGSREFEAELPGKVADAVKVGLGLEAVPEYLWGISMGGSFAVHAASREPERWKGMVIVSSFDRLSGVVEDSLGVFVTVLRPWAEGMIVARGGPDVREVNPVELAAQLRIPVLVVHGDADELIAHERGEALFAAFAGPKKFMTVPRGTHDNVLVTEAPAYAAMAEWFSRQ